MRLYLQHRLQVGIHHLIHIFAQCQRAVRPRRLDTDQRPVLIEIARQYAELPRETGRRVQTEQRRPLGDAQRQYAVEAAAIGLFLRAIFR